MLKECGFNCPITVSHLNEDRIKLLELHLAEVIARNPSFIENLPKCHSSLYQSLNQSQQEENRLENRVFFFLPAHRLIISNLAQNLIDLKLNSHMFSIDNPAFSRILKELIESAIKNANKQPQARRFSKTLLDFAMYVYMISGRASYELFSENLPMPKVSTIRESKE